MTASSLALRRRVPRTPPSAAAVAIATLLAALPLIALASVSARAAILLLGLALSLVALWTWHAWLLSWRVLIGVLLLVILFIPIRRYSLPAALPFELEPYRLWVALIVVAWAAALLAEPARIKIRGCGLEGPLLAFVLAIGLSIAANVGRIQALDVQPEVIKKLTFFVSFIAALYLTASAIQRRADRDAAISLLVAGGAVLSALAIVESRTGFNPFDELSRFVPILQETGERLSDRLNDRAGRLRAYGSAQHSIALGAALAMLLPFAVYLGYRTHKRRWWLCAGLLALGALATVSRTAALMLVVEVIILVILKPAVARRLWPLALPLLVVMHIAMPGTIGAFKSSFFPEGGLIAEQKSGAGTYGSGRIADLGPGLEEWSASPLAGQGYGTRITVRTDPKVNAPILDNQWLGLLLETGIAGVLAMGWILVRAVRRTGRLARKDDSDEAWLMAAFTASIGAFGVGMFTYDTFSFIQVTFLLFLLLGLAAAELRRRPVRSPRFAVRFSGRPASHLS
jgi:O-antigen ligase/polysaccharide polymerase Wzy-like membrane protein